MGEAQVLTHADGTAHRIGAMLREAAEPERIRDAMHRLSVILLSSIRSAARRPVVPVVVMRGGLLMWDAARICLPAAPAGVVVPTRGAYNHDDVPKVAYGNVPHGSSYLLLDPIVNSGNTIVATVDALRRRAGDVDVAVASVYATRDGVSTIHDAAADVAVHALWPDMAVGDDLRLVGVGFDAGDAAFGAAGARHHWTG